MPKVCEYFITPQSPFVYLGHESFVAMAKKHHVQVDLKPCDLGKIFGLSGGLPLAKRAPQRQAYRLLELQRWSEYRGLPLNQHPKFFPVPGDAASKLIIATKLAHGNEAGLALTGAITRAVWAEEKNIADADTLAALATACGHDGKALLKSSDTASVQAEYDRYTDEAIAANVFGAPWFVVDGKGYWGQDRLDFVERAVAK
ncbi:MAG: 2-hydroxychromene-2-carboxylate isomerase [Herminiimonas sp.]|nr:2-hydroxychromene-2-carboxylate isomerase [Herminiimonas sp.]